ncbi:MAG: DNA mismatch repair endonuclease MutL [Holosporaceae bacterium]|jgi:DNA mismatch repair protein MutL|nr:DNA mismatch repair endonuclease MutL [Holosporaceae bacterium]
MTETPIKLLSQNLINQIAAGEVIERPASVIKELIENAVDAGAGEISVKIIDAGKGFISVSDDGCGMDRESLELCILSHATSKLSSENLFDIHTFGFRGEALPSIASISRLSIVSANDSSSEGFTLRLEGAKNLGLSPTNRKRGTTVEVRDLFFATPARLKFLKSNASETENCCDVFNRAALALPEIGFRFTDGDREKFRYAKTDSLQKRIRDVLGESFEKNTFEINAEKDGMRLRGFIGVPTFNRASSNCQYFFVNNRCVKDKHFACALKSAYAGLVPPGRRAAAVLFLDIPRSEVDVNAHPAKTEVRFGNSEKVRFFISSELKKQLSSFGAMKSTTDVSPQKFYPFPGVAKRAASPIAREKETRFFSTFGREVRTSNNFSNSTAALPSPAPVEPEFERDETFRSAPDDGNEISLGNAVCQINNTYIVAENGDELIIVDQHAAAERIALEKLKNNLSLDSQVLLLPEICPLRESQVELLENNRDMISKLGVVYEKLTDDLVSVRSVPAILGVCDAKSLMSDLADELAAFGESYSAEEKIHRVLATVSCHGSLRAGKKMTPQEMNSLLRQMEKTANIAQCCHGRPSYVALSSKNLNKFFERS